jgi:hypothetical protein
MTIDLPLLISIRALSDSSGDCTGDAFRSAVLAASLARGRVITFGASKDLLQEMAEEGLVAQDGTRIRLMPEGEAFIEARRDSSEAQTYTKIVTELLGPSPKLPVDGEFVRGLSRRLKDLIEHTTSRPEEPPVDVSLGAILVECSGPTEVYRSEFHPMWPPDLPVGARWRDAHSAADEWREGSGSLTEVSVSGENLVAVTCAPDCRLRIGGAELTPVRVARISPLPAEVIETAIGRVLARRALELGWRTTGPSARALFDPASEHRTAAAGRPLREYEAFSLSVQAVSDRRSLVWIDEFIHHVTTAADYIEAFGPATLWEAASKHEIELRTEPYGTKGELLAVEGAVDVHVAQADGRRSYFEYWEATHDLTLEEDYQPVLRIRTSTGTYSYPAEMVRLEFLSEPNPKSRGPRVRSPRLRELGISALAGRLFTGEQLSGEGLVLSVIGCVPAVTALGTGTARVFLRAPPLLLFGEAQTAADPAEIFDLSPFAGPRDVEIDHVFWPAGMERAAVEAFIAALARRYFELRLGRLVPSRTVYISYDALGGKEAVASLVRPLRRATRPTGHHVGIAILGGGETAYFGFKRYYPDFARVPIQSVQDATVEGIGGGDGSSLNLLALNCYLKALAEDEPAWALASPAGDRTDRSAFLGIGFSRKLAPRRSGKAAVALHDSRGFGTSWTLCVTPGIERTIDQAWFAVLLDQLLAKWDFSAYDRIVIFRKGRVDSIEADAIRRELRARGLSIEQKFRVISVVDSKRRFFRRSGGILTNPDPGTVLLLSDGSALVAASGVESRGVTRGTVVPIELRVAVGSDELESLAKEYLDLTYLSWSNPQTTWKAPLVLQLADRIAALAREGVPENAIFYLPL